MRTNRLAAFSDGVLAVVITVMVLELDTPAEAGWQALGDSAVGFLTYALSFVYIGIYWNNHHHMFQVVEQVSGAVLWANLDLLFWLSLFPFTTAWIDQTGFARTGGWNATSRPSGTSSRPVAIATGRYDVPRGWGRMASMAVIRANSVLPARREAITLETADGLSLVGELALPLERDPVATLVCVHPLPTHGGMMDSHVFRKAAFRLPALAGVAVLRFNTRGTSSMQGTSEGSFDDGVGERHDVAAALEYADFHDLPRIWLLGWSFGTDLALRYGCDPSVTGLVLMSPPLRAATDADLERWAASGKPVTALVPEHDDYLQPDQARRRFEAVPQAEVIGVDGAKHLWVGDAEKVLDLVVERVAPEVGVPLPREWGGAIETADTSAYADRTTEAFKDVPMPE